jgi:uncharacterized protein
VPTTQTDPTSAPSITDTRPTTAAAPTPRTAPDRLRVGADEVAFRITTAQSGGAVLAFDVRIPAGGGPPMLHRHPPHEIYRVDRGVLAFYVEDEHGRVKRAVARAGGVVSIPGGREHTIRNESDDDARAFVVLAPGADMERFIRAVGEGGLTPGTAEAHGIEMTRPVEAVAPPFEERWATLLRTRRRNGEWVGTPVNLVMDGDRAWFGTPEGTAKVKRLRNFDEVEIAPCTPRGKPTGPILSARARRLEGDEAEAARRRLVAKHRLVYGALVPLELWLKRTRGLYYELSDLRPSAPR